MSTEMAKLDKKQLDIQCRSDGDGMEHTTYLEKKSLQQNQNKQISEVKYSKFTPFSGKRKEPKFVPYEPYKAAVSPIIPASHKSERSKTNLVIDNQKVSSLASSVIQTDSLRKAEYKSGRNMKSSIAIECNEDCKNKINQLEEQIAKLQKENKDLDSQFKVQTEVNADLKKMLIASLGEDMHLKVQYMTEDKARLGMNVLQFTEELFFKEEEIERLSVQCDVLKSKFDASSVMVEELARWKLALTDVLKNAILSLESMLNEHKILSEELCYSYDILKHTLRALHPNSPIVARKETFQGLLQMSKEIQELSISIQERLLGRALSRSNSIFINKSCTENSSIIQNAIQVLKDYEKLPFLINDSDIEYLGHNPGKTACQVLPHLCNKEPTVNCCNHCSGEIQLL